MICGGDGFGGFYGAVNIKNSWACYSLDKTEWTPSPDLKTGTSYAAVIPSTHPSDPQRLFVTGGSGNLHSNIAGNNKYIYHFKCPLSFTLSVLLSFCMSVCPFIWFQRNKNIFYFLKVSLSLSLSLSLCVCCLIFLSFVLSLSPSLSFSLSLSLSLGIGVKESCYQG